MSFYGSGKLIVKPLSAKLHRDTEVWGKMDPYCILRLGPHQKRSKTHQNGGKHPHWNDTFTFYRSSETFLEVQVWDEDTITKDDNIGNGSVSLNPIFQKLESTEWCDLQYHGKKAGQILIQFQYIPDANNQQQQVRYPPAQGQGMNPSQQGIYSPPQGMYQPPYGQYVPPQGIYPPPQGIYPPQGLNYPNQGSYPPPQGIYPPSQGQFQFQGQFQYPQYQAQYPSNQGSYNSQGQNPPQLGLNSPQQTQYPLQQGQYAQLSYPQQAQQGQYPQQNPQQIYPTQNQQQQGHAPQQGQQPVQKDYPPQQDWLSLQNQNYQQGMQQGGFQYGYPPL